MSFDMIISSHYRVPIHRMMKKSTLVRNNILTTTIHSPESPSRTLIIEYIWK